MRNMKRTLVAVTLVALCCGAAWAQAESTSLPDHGFYAYLRAGNQVAHNSAAWNGDTRLQVNAGLGYDINKWLGLELGWLTTGSPKFAVDSPSGNGVASESITGYTLRVLGKYPINETYKLRVGYETQSLSGYYRQTGSGLNPTNENGTQSRNFIALGVEIALDKRSSFIGEYLRSSKVPGDTYYDGLQFGFNYKF